MTAAPQPNPWMTISEKPADNVVAALSCVLSELPGIGKDSKGPAAQGGYAYRGIEAITREAAPLFAKHGIVFVPHVLSWERDDIIVAGKPSTDDRMTISYTVYGPGGIDDCIEVGPIPAVGRDSSDKGANKCMTQAFKYALLQVLCIADGKDDGDRYTHDADPYTEHAPKGVDPVTGEVGPLSNEDISSMKPRDLNDALNARGLELGGTIPEQRDRLWAWNQASGAGASDSIAEHGADEVVAAPTSDEPAVNSPAPVNVDALGHTGDVDAPGDTALDGAMVRDDLGVSPGKIEGEGDPYESWERLDLVAECAERQIDVRANASVPAMADKLRAWDRTYADA